MRAINTQIGVDGIPADAVLLDVREIDEWVVGHAPGSVHIPMSELVARLDEVPDADPLYVICRSGVRSAQVVDFINANGGSSINVAGGLQAWTRRGRPLTCDTGADPRVL